ncbi:MAG: glycosyltransferase [Anaerolineales bacterium]|nr:MAG: glycosyltransferase [Anaerolineales bacterium]
MKVLYISQQHGPHDRRFLSAIAELGHTGLFLCAAPERVQAEHLPAGVHAVQGRIADVVRTHRPDVVHAGPLHTLAWQAAGAGARPLAAMSWGSDILYTAQRSWWARRKVRVALRQARVLIADCQAVVDAAAELGYDPQRAVVFPWGIDLQRFQPLAAESALRQSLSWQDSFVLLHLRSWEAVYDTETALQAFFALAPSQPQLRLLLPGGGHLAPRIRKLVERSGFAERVHMPGYLSQEELPEYYRSADLYISASRSDGSSVSLMEALACELPALVSDIPANREWVQPGQQGWLFPVSDAAALADKIVAAMQTDLKPYAQRARQQAEARADWSKNKLGLQRAYEMAVA